MTDRLGPSIRLLLGCTLFLTALVRPVSPATAADRCPTDANEVATDRPDITNSSLVVPLGSLQAENGLDWTVRDGSNALDATNTRVRFGIVQCTEFLIDIPGYFGSFNASQIGETRGATSIEEVSALRSPQRRYKHPNDSFCPEPWALDRQAALVAITVSRPAYALRR
jgi:hypothetical protein